MPTPPATCLGDLLPPRNRVCGVLFNRICWLQFDEGSWPTRSQAAGHQDREDSARGGLVLSVPVHAGTDPVRRRGQGRWCDGGHRHHEQSPVLGPRHRRPFRQVDQGRSAEVRHPPAHPVRRHRHRRRRLAPPRNTAGWMWDLTVPGNNDHDFYIDTAVAAILAHNCGDQPPLTSLHPDSSLDKSSLDHWHGQETSGIVKSLRPGEQEALRVKADGTIVNGNTRIAVLHSRGYPVDSLPREPYLGRPTTDEDLWELGR